MPKYRITLSDGRIVTVEADQPPTEEAVLSELGSRGAGPTGAGTSTGGRASGAGPGGGLGTGPDTGADWSDIGPMIGSTIGSVLGGVGGGVVGGPGGAYVGATLGAGAGGALGQGAQDLVQGRTPSLGDMGDAGVKQGVLEAGGRALGAGVGALGRGMYRGGVALLPRTMKEAHPNIAATGLKERIALTKRGAAKANREVAGSATTARRMISDAEAGGAEPIDPATVNQAMGQVGQRMRAEAALGLPDETPTLRARSQAFSRQHMGGIPLTRAQELKEVAQDRSVSAYKARDRGAVINNNELLMDEAQARGLREALESRVPNLGATNARTQNLMGVRDAAEHAAGTGHVLSRTTGAAAGALIGGSGGGLLPAVAAAAGGLALTTPGGLTSTGLALDRLAPYIYKGGANAARLAAILAALAEDEPQGAEQ
jgi:hypothetical protein